MLFGIRSVPREDLLTTAGEEQARTVLTALADEWTEIEPVVLSGSTQGGHSYCIRSEPQMLCNSQRRWYGAAGGRRTITLSVSISGCGKQLDARALPCCPKEATLSGSSALRQLLFDQATSSGDFFQAVGREGHQQ